MGARVEMDDARSGADRVHVECSSLSHASGARERGRGLRRGVSGSLVEEARDA
jgi:hypothetical protein